MKLKTVPWRRAGGWALALVVPLLTLAIGIIVLTGGSSDTRSFLIEARTTGATIQFRGLNNVWPLGFATICKPLPSPNRNGQRGDGPCDERVFELSSDRDLLLELTDGSTVTVSSIYGGGLEISITGTKGYPDNTRILIAAEEWRSLGALAFRGIATIGGQMGSGLQWYVLGGRYEVRERPRVPLGGSGRIDVIKSGALLRGEQVSIVTPDGPSAVVGHITPVLDQSGGLNIVTVSLPGNTALSLGYIGGNEASIITPDWIDHASANPILIAMTFILTVCIGAGQLLFDAIGFLRGSRIRNPLEPEVSTILNSPEIVTEECDGSSDRNEDRTPNSTFPSTEGTQS